MNAVTLGLSGFLRYRCEQRKVLMMERFSIGILLAVLVTATLASAQQPPTMTQQTQNIKRTPLQRFEVPGSNFETVIGIAEIVPNVSVGRHTHPGPESGYMLEGEMCIEDGPGAHIFCNFCPEWPDGNTHAGIASL
jgi:hypothetical protein